MIKYIYRYRCRYMMTGLLLASCSFNKGSLFQQFHVSHWCEDHAVIGLARQPSAQEAGFYLDLSVSQWPSGLLREAPTRPRPAMSWGTCWGSTWRGEMVPTLPGPWSFQMGPVPPGTSSPYLASMEWFSSSGWPATSSERTISPWKIFITQIWPLSWK